MHAITGRAAVPCVRPSLGGLPGGATGASSRLCRQGGIHRAAKAGLSGRYALKSPTASGSQSRGSPGEVHLGVEPQQRGMRRLRPCGVHSRPPEHRT